MNFCVICLRDLIPSSNAYTCFSDSVYVVYLFPFTYQYFPLHMNNWKWFASFNEFFWKFCLILRWICIQTVTQFLFVILSGTPFRSGSTISKLPYLNHLNQSGKGTFTKHSHQPIYILLFALAVIEVIIRVAEISRITEELFIYQSNCLSSYEQ